MLKLATRPARALRRIPQNESNMIETVQYAVVGGRDVSYPWSVTLADSAEEAIRSFLVWTKARRGFKKWDAWQREGYCVKQVTIKLQDVATPVS